MKDVVLLLHITGALASLVYIVASLGQAVAGRGWRSASRVAGWVMAAWQAISGVLLLALVPGVSVKAVCGQGLALLVVVLAVQRLVVWRLAPADRC